MRQSQSISGHDSTGSMTTFAAELHDSENYSLEIVKLEATVDCGSKMATCAERPATTDQRLSTCGGTRIRDLFFSNWTGSQRIRHVFRESILLLCYRCGCSIGILDRVTDVLRF